MASHRHARHCPHHHQSIPIHCPRHQSTPSMSLLPSPPEHPPMNLLPQKVALPLFRLKLLPVPSTLPSRGLHLTLVLRYCLGLGSGFRFELPIGWGHGSGSPNPSWLEPSAVALTLTPTLTLRGWCLLQRISPPRLLLPLLQHPRHPEGGLSCHLLRGVGLRVGAL